MMLYSNIKKFNSILFFILTILTTPCHATGKERINLWNELLKNNQFVELIAARAQASPYNPFEINWLGHKAATTQHPLLIFFHLQERFGLKNITVEELPVIALLILEAAFQAGRDAEYLRLSQGQDAYKQAQNIHKLLRSLTYKLLTKEYLALLENNVPFQQTMSEFLQQIQHKDVVTFFNHTNPRWMLFVNQKPGRFVGYYDDIIVANPPAYKTLEIKEFRELEFYKQLFAKTQEALRTWKEFFTTEKITTPFPELKHPTALEKSILQQLSTLEHQAKLKKQKPIKQEFEDLNGWVLSRDFREVLARESA